MVLPLLKLTLPRDIQPIHPALLPTSLFFNCNVIIQKWFKSSRSLYLVLRWWPWWLHWWLNRRTLEIFAATRRAPAVKQTHQSEHSRGWSSMSVNPTSVKDVEKSWNRKCVALLIRDGSVDQPWFWTLNGDCHQGNGIEILSLKPSWIEKSWKYLSKLLDNWKINGPPWGNPYMAAKKENASMQDSNPKIWNWSMPVATVGASCFKF